MDACQCEMERCCCNMSKMSLWNGELPVRIAEVLQQNDKGVTAKWRGDNAEMERYYCDFTKVSLRNGVVTMRTGKVLL